MKLSSNIEGTLINEFKAIRHEYMISQRNVFTTVKKSKVSINLNDSSTCLAS